MFGKNLSRALIPNFSIKKYPAEKRQGVAKKEALQRAKKWGSQRSGV